MAEGRGAILAARGLEARATRDRGGNCGAGRLWRGSGAGRVARGIEPGDETVRELSMSWRFDPDHSQVEWACRYLGLSVIRGAFNRVSAEVHVDDPDPAKWTMSVEIDPTSLISAGFGRREEALKGENFLEADRFPELRFRSDRVSRRGDALDISGELLLHGVARQVTFSGRDNGEAIDRRGLRRRGFSGTTTVRRTDYGIPATGPSFVAEDVDISVEVQLIYEDG